MTIRTCRALHAWTGIAPTVVCPQKHPWPSWEARDKWTTSQFLDNSRCLFDVSFFFLFLMFLDGCIRLLDVYYFRLSTSNTSLRQSSGLELADGTTTFRHWTNELLWRDNDTWSLQGSLMSLYYQPKFWCTLGKRKITANMFHRFLYQVVSPPNGFLFDDPCKNRWSFIETLVQIWYSHNCLSSQSSGWVLGFFGPDTKASR